MSDQGELWTAVAQLLRAQLTESVWFSTFSEVVPVVNENEHSLVIQVPSTLARDRILTRYQPLITDALAELGEGDRRFDVVISAPEPSSHVSDISSAETETGNGDGDTGEPPADRSGIDRIRRIRDLDEKHHFTLVCRDFAQLGQFVHIGNAVFRAVKAATPGRYTFILPASKEVPRRLLHPKKKTVGVRIPDHPVAQALLAELGEPLLSSTLLLPDEEEPMTQGWEIKDQLDHVVDAVVDSGDCGTEPTTVIDFSNGEAEIVRKGAGDVSRFA